MSYSKGVLRIEDPSQLRVRRELMGSVLMKATVDGCEQLETTGLGFVLSAMSHWTVEGIESGLGKPLSDYLRALSDIADPKKNIRQKEFAEQRRRKAFDQMSEFANATDGWSQQLDPNDPQP